MECIEEETGFKIKKNENSNDMYEWGFDLTDFNDEENDGGGDVKFEELLKCFELRCEDGRDVKNGFEWSNSDKSIILITGNNPITGENRIRGRMNEPGYLSYVGVSCKCSSDLQDVINECRKRASYIKEESNARIYI
jgi:hypothetical protein